MTGSDLPVSVGGSPAKVGEGGGCGSLWGQGHSRWRLWQLLIGVGPQGCCLFPAKTWPHPTACRHQCWDASGQTTNRAGTQPHPSAERLFKVFLKKQLPHNKHTHRHCPAHQWDKTQLHPSVGGYQSFPPANLHKPLSLIHQGADSRRQKNYNPAACKTETTITES